MSSGIKKTTKDGFESCYEVNLLSNFALVVPLLQRGIFASDARIINTSSQFMFESSALDPQDPNCAKLTKGVEEGGSLSTLATIGVYASAKAGVVVCLLTIFLVVIVLTVILDRCSRENFKIAWLNRTHGIASPFNAIIQVYFVHVTSLLFVRC